MKQRHGAKWLVIAACVSLSMMFIVGVFNNCRAAEPKEIVVGAPASRTGPGAPFGIYEEWGYNTLVKDINKSGGLYLSKYKKKLPVKLVLYDDESTPEKAVQAQQRLILKDKVNALFSTGNPMNVIPCYMIAEKEGVPMRLVGSSDTGVPGLKTQGRLEVGVGHLLRRTGSDEDTVPYDGLGAVQQKGRPFYRQHA